MRERATMTTAGLSRRGVAAAALGLPLLTTACATPKRLAAVPIAQTGDAQAAISNARFFPDRDPEPIVREMAAAYAKEVAWLKQQGHTGPLPPVAFLSISGGGGDGAYGAGLLVGWTEHGDRPAFKLVTGISTGALIAPFAFAGPKYDSTLRDTYTKTTDKDIFRKRYFTAAIWDDAMADTGPMMKTVGRYVTPELLADIAAEYAKGRLLLVGTTNLDAREPVYWNMGALASSQDPAALELFKKVTVASASIPGAFPPVMIDVTVDGHKYQEMHVDGGATRQVFMYPQNIHLGQLSLAREITRQRSVYIIRNSRLDPEWASVDRRTMSIVGRAVSSLIQTQGVGDLIRMYLTATRDGVDYNLAYIPPEFTAQKRSEFDVNYMRPLFELGRERAAKGYVWAKYPPGYAPTEAARDPLAAPR